jgi:hypothetical protein
MLLDEPLHLLVVGFVVERGLDAAWCHLLHVADEPLLVLGVLDGSIRPVLPRGGAIR